MADEEPLSIPDPEAVEEDSEDDDLDALEDQDSEDEDQDSEDEDQDSGDEDLEAVEEDPQDDDLQAVEKDFQDYDLESVEEDSQDDDLDLDLDSDKSSDSESDYGYDYDYDYDFGSNSDSDFDSRLFSGEEGDEKQFIDDTLEALKHPTLLKMRKKKEERYLKKKNRFDFPNDPEHWCEKDLQELWTDGPPLDKNTGWDPDSAGLEEWQEVAVKLGTGQDPRIAPFYVPYRKPNPVVPKCIPSLRTPLGLLEELDRIEEVLKWVSYIFPNGNTYEGTVWDDLAHGKGVFVAKNGLVRYEGEWFQNDQEGHGVVEVDIPNIEPVPGSKLEDEMRAEGRIISMDYLPEEDKEWLEKDIEDSINLAGGRYEIPFYENKEWIRQFGKKPEKGRYRYAGQWKHGRMHGCGVYEVNERMRYGRFYFGELLEDAHGCDEKISALHSGIAEVAAAKARMFVNKPDGMVREERGPYGDPQHAYLYEGEDVWMAPGFINQFYEVPEYWESYVAEVDTERDMWLNSFYRAPLRLPMPAELEHWWGKDHVPEFILVNKENDSEVDDPSDPHTEAPLIVHTRSGRIINFVEDEEHGVRLFWQPKLKDGEDVDADKVAFLPDGYNDFYGIEEEEVKEEETFLERVGKACQTVLDRLDKWVEETKRESDRKVKEMEKKLEILDAEMRLDEAYEEMDLELKEMEEEEEMKEMEAPKVAIIDKETVIETVPEEKVVAEEAEMKDSDEAAEDDDDEEEDEEDDEEEDEEEDDEAAASSFGTVRSDDGSSFSKNGPGKGTPKEPPFSALSLGFASCSLISAVSSRLHQSVTSVRKNSFKPTTPTSCPTVLPRSVEVVCYPPQTLAKNGSLRAVRQETHQPHIRKTSKGGGGSSSQLYSLSRILSSCLAQSKARADVNHPRRRERSQWIEEVDDRDLASILSLHNQVNVPEMVHQ